MKWAATFLFFLVLSCGEKKYTARECRSLELTAVQRCFDGNSQTGKYVGDLKCWPFSKPQRMRGVWVIEMEASVFAPNAIKVTPEPPSSLLWLQTDLLQRPEVIAAGQGAGPLAYLIDFQGRRSLCEGNFGQWGAYRGEVIVQRIYSIRKLPPPASGPLIAPPRSANDGR